MSCFRQRLFLIVSGMANHYRNTTDNVDQWISEYILLENSTVIYTLIINLVNIFHPFLYIIVIFLIYTEVTVT